VPYTKDERVPAVIFAVVFFAELAYRYARKAILLLRQPLLWPVFLFFLPKINFIGFRNETAGIRFDDSILLILTIFLFVGWITNLNFTIEPLPLAGFAVVGIFCLSNLINLGQGHSSFLYSLRLVEYMIFYWSGRSLVRSGYELDVVVKLLLGLNCAVIVLQFTGIVGGFTANGYESVVGRPFGLSANHPAEMGALFNLLFAALVFGSKSVKFWRWSLLVGAGILLIESRSALLAHCLLILIYVYKHSKNKIGFARKAALVSALLIAVFAAIPSKVTGRSADLFSQQNFETFRDVYDNIPVDRQFKDVDEGGSPEDSPEGVDVSWYIRVFKWTEVVKTMLAQPWTIWILGVGPGGIGVALDGGWLRLIVETGIVGTFAFLVLMRKISKLSTACAMSVFALAVNMLMIDSHMAYKVMAFLFFLVGTEVQSRFSQPTADGLLVDSKLRLA
jgi:hypothetical protein